MIAGPPKTMATLQLGLVAGETSGDLLASAVLEGLHRHLGSASFQACGIGGPAMTQNGFEAWWGIDSLSVSGYTEVLREYPRLLRLRRDVVARMTRYAPDLFLGVDAPDFNLGVAARLRASGLRTAHFISPSIWAWRAGRIDTIRKSVDHMLLVFPFEAQIYAAAGIAATYVGHPLADRIPKHPDRAAARLRLAAQGAPSQGSLIALLPGSRRSEINHIAPDFFRAAQWLAQQRADMAFVVPAATPALHRLLIDMKATVAPNLGVTILQGSSYDALAACEGTLVASGTASLEAALFSRPMVISYRLSRLNFAIMRRLALQPWVGLPNILAGEALVPELLQDDATPTALGRALLRQLDDDHRRDLLSIRFAQLHEQLACGCADRAATVLLELAQKGGGSARCR